MPGVKLNRKENIWADIDSDAEADNYVEASNEYERGKCVSVLFPSFNHNFGCSPTDPSDSYIGAIGTIVKEESGGSEVVTGKQHSTRGMRQAPRVSDIGTGHIGSSVP